MCAGHVLWALQPKSMKLSKLSNYQSKVGTFVKAKEQEIIGNLAMQIDFVTLEIILQTRGPYRRDHRNKSTKNVSHTIAHYGISVCT